MSERLSIEGLRYARAVAETGSFSAAARAHGVTQPALSSGISRLEKHLGGRLFDRSPRGITTTPFGRAMLPLIERALDSVNTIESEARRRTAPAPRSVRVGVSPLVNPTLMATMYSAVTALPSHAPHQLVLREANMSELRQGLADDELDLMIVPAVEPMARYEHRIIDSEALVLVEQGLCTGRPLGLDHLVNKQLILAPDACGLTTFTRCLLAENALSVAIYPGEAATYQGLEEWAGLGLGAALLPESKLSSPDVPHRGLIDDEGNAIEIFYEAAWSPASPLAADLALLVGRITRPHR